MEWQHRLIRYTRARCPLKSSDTFFVHFYQCFFVSDISTSCREHSVRTASPVKYASQCDQRSRAMTIFMVDLLVWHREIERDNKTISPTRWEKWNTNTSTKVMKSNKWRQFINDKNLRIVFVCSCTELTFAASFNSSHKTATDSENGEERCWIIKHWNILMFHDVVT